jgi:hypothetical protein
MQWHSAKSPPFASPVVQWGKVPSSAIDDGKLSTWQRQKKAATVFIGSETPARKRTVSIGAQSQVQPSSLIQFGVSPPSANKKSSQAEGTGKELGIESRIDIVLLQHAFQVGKSAMTVDFRLVLYTRLSFWVFGCRSHAVFGLDSATAWLVLS